MAVYTNNLKLKEIADGAESGSWGTSTNTNLDLIAQAFGYASYDGFSTDADATVTVQNSGATEEFTRSMYVKITSSATLTATRTLTIAPNDISRVLFIENATTGSQIINISQGSGANVAIGSGQRKCVYLDGAGSGAAVVEVFDSFEVKDSLKISGSTPTLTIGDGDAEDTKIVFNGNAQDFYVGLDDSADDLVFGLGSALGTNRMLRIDSANTGGEVVIGGTQAGIGDSTLHAGKASGGNIISMYTEATTALICADTDNGDPVAFGADNGTNFTVRLGTSATRRFEVLNSGNISILTDGQGILMNSPNGTEYKVSVSNAGALVVENT
tara:strand:- start:2784 stop:3767 length:984 start_codon:yes stop_codon:yes gene_type:complete